jgi:hypothetical protein
LHIWFALLFWAGTSSQALPPKAGSTDPYALRESARGLKSALSQAGLPAEYLRVETREGKLFLAVELNGDGWQKAMRSPCRRRLTLTLWAFGFRHSSDDSASEFKLSKEVGTAESLGELTRLSDELKSGAAECRDQETAKKANEGEEKTVELPQNSPPPDELPPPKNFAELAARARHWPLSKRLSPAHFNFDWGASDQRFASVLAFQRALLRLHYHYRMQARRPAPEPAPAPPVQVPVDTTPLAQPAVTDPPAPEAKLRALNAGANGPMMPGPVLTTGDPAAYTYAKTPDMSGSGDPLVLRPKDSNRSAPTGLGPAGAVSGASERTALRWKCWRVNGILVCKPLPPGL